MLPEELSMKNHWLNRSSNGNSKTNREAVCLNKGQACEILFPGRDGILSSFYGNI